MSFWDAGGPVVAGVGVYTLPQAATLVRLRLATVDAIVGLHPADNDPQTSYPIAVAEIDQQFGEAIVTFQGLMALWVAAELHGEGVPWPVIRYAAYRAGKILKTVYPLTLGSFRTDGRRVFLSIKNNAERAPKTALDLLSRQHVFEEVIERSLSPTIVVRGKDGRIKKWFPLGLDRSVVLDPERRFGEPIDPVSGVPTSSLAEAFHAEKGNLRAAASWFNTSQKAVKDAAAFERWLNKN